MLTFKNADAAGIVEKNLGPEAAEELKSKVPDFLPFPDLEGSAKDDIAFLKGTKLVPDSVTISGWIYECETGKTKQVA
jgi:carbonic anhydrase